VLAVGGRPSRVGSRLYLREGDSARGIGVSTGIGIRRAMDSPLRFFDRRARRFPCQSSGGCAGAAAALSHAPRARRLPLGRCALSPVTPSVSILELTALPPVVLPPINDYFPVASPFAFPFLLISLFPHYPMLIFRDRWFPLSGGAGHPSPSSLPPNGIFRAPSVQRSDSP